MSKNNQKNLSEINLGNQTYDRGFADGLAGRPKSIKKTHRHAHRYHAGHRKGMEQHCYSLQNSVIYTPQGSPVVLAVHGEGAKRVKRTFWQGLKGFLAWAFGFRK